MLAEDRCSSRSRPRRSTATAGFLPEDLLGSRWYPRNVLLDRQARVVRPDICRSPWHPVKQHQTSAAVPGTPSSSTPACFRPSKADPLRPRAEHPYTFSLSLQCVWTACIAGLEPSAWRGGCWACIRDRRRLNRSPVQAATRAPSAPEVGRHLPVLAATDAPGVSHR